VAHGEHARSASAATSPSRADQPEGGGVSGGRPLEVAWPLAPLLERSGRTLEQLARRAGYRQGNVWRLAERGYLSDQQADLFAIRAGLHPGLVWSTWFDVELVGGERLPVAPLAGVVDGSTASFLRRTGISSKSWYRWRDLGTMPAGTGRAAAERLGLSFSEVWPSDCVGA
jgi:lambda repressor-like predicted transcriptional regulator